MDLLPFCKERFSRVGHLGSDRFDRFPVVYRGSIFLKQNNIETYYKHFIKQTCLLIVFVAYVGVKIHLPFGF